MKNNIEIKTEYGVDKIVDLISENICDIPSFIKYSFSPKRLSAQICGKIDKNGFELRNSLDQFWSLRAYGRFKNSEGYTVIEIDFKKPAYLNPIASLTLHHRWKYDQKKLLEFLCEILDINVNQLNDDMADSGIELRINSKEPILVYNKAGHPELDIEEFKTKQEEIYARLADLVIDHIPEHWDIAILEISAKRDEFEFSFTNSKNEKKHLPSSDNMLGAARELKNLYNDNGKEWNKLILSLSWDSNSEGWRMSADNYS